MNYIYNEVLNEVYEENKTLANAFDELYGLLKHLMSEDEYNELVAKSILHDKITDK